MGLVYQKTSVKGYIIAVITFCSLLSNKFADGRTFVGETQNLEIVKHKGTIKTIQSKNGEVIDCVDIYKQPAFDHPLLKNHTIQMLQSSSIQINNGDEMGTKQRWNENGEYCPKGTIPILRSPKLDYPRKVPFISPTSTQQFNQSLYSAEGHEYAQVSYKGKNYGASASINVWNPNTFGEEFSLSQIWVAGGPIQEVNSAEAGWIVNRAGHKETTLFVFWTGDGYKSSGCYNLECPGFVQVNSKILLGGELAPISIFNDKQYEIRLTISKDKESGHWWLQFADEKVGYWPSSLYNSLADSSDLINWGGEIINKNNGGRHTATQMGSGHFPNEGYAKASYFTLLKYMEEDGSFKDARSIKPYTSNPTCYDIAIRDDSTSFFYGGPGFSDNCP